MPTISRQAMLEADKERSNDIGYLERNWVQNVFPTLYVNLFNAVTGTPTSDHLEVAGWDEVSVALRASGASGVISVSAEGSFDNSNWFSLGAAITTVPSATVFDLKWARFFRLKMTDGPDAGTMTADVMLVRRS